MNEAPGTSPLTSASSAPASSVAVPSEHTINPRMVIGLKTILTPVDFSDASKQALHYACAFAGQFQSRIILLHVVEFNYVGSEFGTLELSQITTEMQENAGKQLEEWSRNEIGQRVPAECAVRTGRPYTEIVEAASDMEADLIIIATHGHTSLTHVVLGSTVERVVRYAPCPVLIVRAEGHQFVMP